MSKNPIKVIVVDDEAPAREELLYLLSECENVKVVGSAKDCFEAEELLKKEQVDLIFMDIEMPGMSGVRFAEKLVDKGSDVKFIFTTAFDGFAVEAFDLNAVDYLLKPLRLSKLRRAIERAGIGINSTKEEVKKSDDIKYISVYSGESIIPVKISSISVAEAKGRYTWITAGVKEYQTTMNFRQVEELLSSPEFFLCHRSYIINIDKIEVVELGVNSNYMLRMSGRKELIPVSRNKKDALRAILNI